LFEFLFIFFVGLKGQISVRPLRPVVTFAGGAGRARRDQQSLAK
jgi:hypothetical protein